MSKKNGKNNKPAATADRKAKPQVVRRVVEPDDPVLRFSPTAWAKMLYMRDRAQLEVGGFGIAAANDLLLVEDFVTVKQSVTMASVAFDDAAVADFFDEQIDAGRQPQQFMRIWLHTHPGGSASPSAVDEETFSRVFGSCDWAIMCIIAKGGQTFARLRFNAGPGGQVEIPVQVDFSRPFGASDHALWKAEYELNVHAQVFAAHPLAHDPVFRQLQAAGGDAFFDGIHFEDETDPYLEELDEEAIWPW